MLDDADPINIASESLDPDLTCPKCLETCRQSGVEPASRERALGLMVEFTEVLSGRPEPTTN